MENQDISPENVTTTDPRPRSKIGGNHCLGETDPRLDNDMELGGKVFQQRNHSSMCYIMKIIKEN